MECPRLQSAYPDAGSAPSDAELAEYALCKEGISFTAQRVEVKSEVGKGKVFRVALPKDIKPE